MTFLPLPLSLHHYLGPGVNFSLDLSAGGAVEKSEGGCNPYNVFSFTKKAPRTVDYKRSFSAEYSRHFYVALATEAAQWVAPTTGIVECM